MYDQVFGRGDNTRGQLGISNIAIIKQLIEVPVHDIGTLFNDIALMITGIY